jgi:phosphoribosylaminoimidazole-succinocarboxamide synthase
MAAKASWKKLYSGKVREVWSDHDKKFIALVAGDGVSALDEQLGVIIPNKGKILTDMSAEWFRLTADIVPNAFITSDVSDMPNVFHNSHFKGRTTLMRSLKMLPIEAIVRGFITGSMWKKYCDGQRTICGYEMPEGLQNSQQLPEAIFTPTTKAPQGEHDADITFDEMISIIHDCGHDDDESHTLATLIRDYSLKIYNFCRDYAMKHGVIVADMKLEFGIDDEGVLCVADEICTPDCARFWSHEDYKVGCEQASMDKQIIRNWIADAKARGDKISIPDDILKQTQQQYRKCYELLFS